MNIYFSGSVAHNTDTLSLSMFSIVSYLFYSLLAAAERFLADRTNGRAYASVASVCTGWAKKTKPHTFVHISATY